MPGVTHQLLGSGFVPTRCLTVQGTAVPRTVQFVFCSCVVGTQVNDASYDIRGQNPSSCKCENSYSLKFKIVSHFRQINKSRCISRAKGLASHRRCNTVMIVPLVWMRLASWSNEVARRLGWGKENCLTDDSLGPLLAMDFVKLLVLELRWELFFFFFLFFFDGTD